MRHRRGTGSATLLKNGRWWARLMLPSGKRASGGTFTTREEADRMLVAMRAELPEFIASGKIPCAPTEPKAPETVSTWGETWLKRRERAKIVRNPDADASAWNRYVARAPIASVALEDLRGKDVRDWLRGMLERRTAKGAPLATQTVRNALNLLRCALGDAAAEELLAVNPAAGVKVPTRRETSKWTYLDAAEVKAVLACETMPRGARLLYTVAIFTGMRAGEMWALTWGDVTLDGDRPEVIVRRSHQHAPKNGKERSIPLFPQAREALAALKKMAEHSGPSDLVFPAPKGGQRIRNDDAGWNTRKVRSKARVGHREAAGIMRRVVFHSLRHTCASHLVMGTWSPAPWPIAEACKFLGHSSVTVTERYAHLSPGFLHDRVREASRPAAPDEVQSVEPEAVAEGSAEASKAVTTSVTTTSCELVTPDAFSRSHPRDLNPRPAVYETARQHRENRGFVAPVTTPQPDRPSAGDLAVALLRAVDEGAPAGVLARSLAVEVLATVSPSTTLWARALAVVEGGALRMRHAVELAGLVLDAAGEGSAERSA